MMNTHPPEKAVLLGVWKLDHFKHAANGVIYQYSDILMFSKRYYSNFQADRSEADSIRCHMGMYKMAQDTVTFQIQISNDLSAIGSVATGNYRITGITLEITFDHGAMPGTWIYKRLSD